MKMKVVLDSKLKDKPCEAILNEYFKRISHFVDIKFIDVKTSENEVSLTSNTVYEKLYGMGSGYYKVCLDPVGKELDTYAFKDWLTDKIDNSINVIFYIGGAYGHNKLLKAKADELISLSKLTLAHRLALMVLAEQIYRCLTIIKGHPYHK